MSWKRWASDWWHETLRDWKNLWHLTLEFLDSYYLAAAIVLPCCLVLLIELFIGGSKPKVAPLNARPIASPQAKGSKRPESALSRISEPSESEPPPTKIEQPPDFAWLPPSVTELREKLSPPLMLYDDQLPKSLAQHVEELSPIETPRPAYPELARKSGDEGYVMCCLKISAEGLVTRIEIVTSTGPEFTQTTREAVARWRFKPRREDGQAVPTSVLYSIPFDLDRPRVTEPPGPKKYVDMEMAWVMAQKLIENSQLKAPKTAEWPNGGSDEFVSYSKLTGIFTIDAWVDAENSAGVKVRTAFQAAVKRVSDEWILSSFVVIEKPGGAPIATPAPFTPFPAREYGKLEDKALAWVMAQGLIEDTQLKAPATAEWPTDGWFPGHTHDEFVTYIGNGKYVIKAWVDAENVFGAKVRTRFQAVVTDEGAGVWALNEFIVLP